MSHVSNTIVFPNRGTSLATFWAKELLDLLERRLVELLRGIDGHERASMKVAFFDLPASLSAPQYIVLLDLPWKVYF